jgi:tetratricopeptide (TPR) repeat protein
VRKQNNPSVRLYLAALLIGVVTTIANTTDFQKPPDKEDIALVFQEGFAASTARLEAMFVTNHKSVTAASPLSSENSAFTAWLDLWRWCKLFTQLSEQDTPELLDGDFAKELLSDSSLSRMFFATLFAQDDAPRVLANIRSIREAHPQKWREYISLAIAIAVVNDVQVPSTWPHHQVQTALVPISILPVEEQFSRWVSANEERQLLLDPRKLSPSQLKFVVDAFVTDDELAWARKNVRLSRTRFDQAYFQVAYHYDRLKAQEYDWNSGPYTLKEIRKKGGICVDQAYYASIAGKANGLPTLFFTGQGRDGGHAWFGYMRSDDRWEIDCGRYSQQNYAIGEALDPQTWQPISDHEMELLAARFRDKPEFAASENMLAVAEILEKAGETQPADRALQKAIELCPKNSSAWEARGAFLKRTGVSAQERILFHKQAATQFSTQADLRVLHQQQLSAIYQEQGDSSSSQKIERQILLQNRHKRSDLSVNIAAKQLDTHLEAGNIQAAEILFRKQIQSLGETGGGNFFYDVATPYINLLIKNGDKSDARRTIDLVRRKLTPDQGSIIDNSLNKMEAEAR